MQDGLTAFNLKQKLGAIFIDIEMAFDRVWHNGLLFKLDRDGIPNQLGKWIQNYLALFTARPIETGVPQGSVLGRYSLYCSSTTWSARPHHQWNQQSRYSPMTYDAWVASRSLKVIEIRLQKQLDHIEEWMSDWRTKLSITKAVYTVLNKSGTFIHNQIELTYQD